MWYEKLDYKVDIEKLREEVRNSVFPLGDQVVQGKEFETPQYHGFGGWSILSKSGDWKDGWEAIQTDQGDTLETFLPTDELVYKAYKHFGICHSLEHDKPTQACVGEIKKIIDTLREYGLTPRRARITCLKAHCKSLVHKDADTDEYMARLHIPLWSNKRCVHICDGETLNMKDDGSVYVLWTNLWHQIRNDSDEDRYHIVIDVYDTEHVTNEFKYMGDFSELEMYVNFWRQKVDASELTEDDITFFESIKNKYVTGYNV